MPVMTAKDVYQASGDVADFQHVPEANVTISRAEPFRAMLDHGYVTEALTAGVRQQATLQLVEPDGIIVKTIDHMFERVDDRTQIVSVRWVIHANYPGTPRRVESWLASVGARISEQGEGKQVVERWSPVAVHVYDDLNRVWSPGVAFLHRHMGDYPANLLHDDGQSWPDPLGTGLVHSLT